MDIPGVQMRDVCHTIIRGKMKKALLFLFLLPMILGAVNYSLDELIEHGLSNSWTMRSSELTYKSAVSQYQSSKWSLLPDVNLSAGVNKDFTDNSAPKSSLSSSTGISVSKTISLNDADYFQYRYAKLDKETAQLELEQGKRDYIFSVLSAYVDVLSSQKQLASLNKNLEIQTRVLDQSRTLLQLGKTTNFEVKQNEIAVMNSRISILKTQNTIETKRRELFSLVQLPDEGYDLTDLNVDTSLSAASMNIESSSELQILNQQLRRNKLVEKQGFLDNFPRVNLSYNLDRTISGEDFDFDTYHTNHGVSLTLSYPLWNYFTNKESTSRSKISSQLTLLNLENKTDNLNKQYTQMSEELNYLYQLDTMYSEKLAQSQEQIRIAEERYRLGLIELLELDKTRTEYIDADIAYNSNRYQILISQENLNKLTSQKILGKW